MGKATSRGVPLLSLERVSGVDDQRYFNTDSFPSEPGSHPFHVVSFGLSINRFKANLSINSQV